MRFPFPSFGDLVKVFWLIIQTGVCIFLATLVFFGFIAIGSLLNNYSFYWLGLFIALTVFPILFFTYVHYLFWGQRGVKRIVIFATAPSWNEGLWQWFIAFTASAIVMTLMFLLLYSATSGAFESGDRDLASYIMRSLISNPRLTAFFNVLWFMIAAVMMAWKRQIQRQKTQTTAKVNSSTNSPTNSSTTTIDEELSRLKNKMADEQQNRP
jgi:hypothetical protein